MSKRLQFNRGEEYTVILSENILDKEDFLYETYKTAIDALVSLVKKTGSPMKNQDNQDDWLYRFSQNIIVFAGDRGQGKTSAMMTFANALESSETIKKVAATPNREELADCEFCVIDPPIDPTELEANQNILLVVLARIQMLAEQIWSEIRKDYRSEKELQELLGKKNDLVDEIRNTLRSVNAAKGKEFKINDLTDLHSYGDTAGLKRSFFHLVKSLLSFSKCGRTESAKRYLVLQLDDTDFQISRGHEIMEDIRKHLTIPNLVILMATDTDALRDVINQHYVQDFQTALGQQIVEKERLRATGAKYFAKMLPPTCIAYMPNLNEEIREQREEIRLVYLDKNIPNRNVLDNNFPFQETVLRFIFQKTHLIFAAHTSYLNNIIPVTLRGLAQLLGLIDSMEEPAVIDYSSREAFADSLINQCTILQENLAKFENWFLHDWVQSKLCYDDLQIIKKIAEQVPEERISFAWRELETWSSKHNTNNEHNDTNTDIYVKSSPCSFSDLQFKIYTLKEVNRQSSDYYFLFAIHTIFSIENSKAVVKIRKNTCVEWERNKYRDNCEEVYLQFSYENIKGTLPDRYYLHELYIQNQNARNEKACLPFDIFCSEFELDHKISDSKPEIQRVQRVVKTGSGKKYFYSYNLLNFFNRFMEKTEVKISDREPYNMQKQESIFKLHEFSAYIAANCEVQEQIGKEVCQFYNKIEEAENQRRIKILLTNILYALTAINSSGNNIQYLKKIDDTFVRLEDSMFNDTSCIDELIQLDICTEIANNLCYFMLKSNKIVPILHSSDSNGMIWQCFYNEVLQNNDLQNAKGRNVLIDIFEAQGMTLKGIPQKHYYEKTKSRLEQLPDEATFDHFKAIINEMNNQVQAEIKNSNDQ